jgi:hypothetical protein
LSESKELNVNFQDLESFLADPDPHDLMAIRPRHPNGHFGACIRLVYVWATACTCGARGDGYALYSAPLGALYTGIEYVLVHVHSECDPNPLPGCYK